MHRIVFSSSKQSLQTKKRHKETTNANLRKNSINNTIGKSMIAISDKVLLVDKKIMVGVKLPKFAIYYIEVLIREVPELTKNRKRNYFHKSEKKEF